MPAACSRSYCAGTGSSLAAIDFAMASICDGEVATTGPGCDALVDTITAIGASPREIEKLSVPAAALQA